MPKPNQNQANQRKRYRHVQLCNRTMKLFTQNSGISLVQATKRAMNTVHVRVSTFLEHVQPTTLRTLAIVPVKAPAEATMLVVRKHVTDVIPYFGTLALIGQDRFILGRVDRVISDQKEGIVIQVKGRAQRNGPVIKVWLLVPYKAFTPATRKMIALHGFSSWIRPTDITLPLPRMHRHYPMLPLTKPL